MTDNEEKLNEVIVIDEKTEDKTESETVNTSLSHIATAGIEPTNENTTASEIPIRKEIELGLKYIIESNLTDEQKKLTLQIYDSVKNIVKDIIPDETINETVKITKTVGHIIKQLESIKVDDKSPSGTDKKAVAIQLGRIIIKELISDETKILTLYDVVAEPILEAMIDVSKVVNTVVMEVTRKCCPGLFELFRLMRRK
jgi:hypothetical protein